MSVFAVVFGSPRAGVYQIRMVTSRYRLAGAFATTLDGAERELHPAGVIV